MGGYRQRNWPAPPCPNCGKEDAARMGSTAWGHNFSCCSDECGRAFEKSEKRRQLEHRNALMALAAAEQHVRMWGPLPDRADELADEVDMLRKEGEVERAALVNIMLDVEEWENGTGEAQWAGTVLQRIKQRVKHVMNERAVESESEGKSE